MMSSTVPKISIVTPSCNQAQFLEAAIQSILSQNYPNLEYIIIDGGSTDGSLDIIKKYESHLSFWISEPDGGQYEALNKGFIQTTGDIMAWLNSDDMYFPWTLHTVAAIMTALPEVEWLTTQTPAFWDWDGFCVGVKQIPGYSREAFLDGMYVPWGSQTLGWIQQESTFWRRSVWEKAGAHISTTLQYAGDFELWSRFYAHAELYGTASLLGGYRYQSAQRGRQHDIYKAEAEQALDAMRRQFQWTPSVKRKLARACHLPKLPKIRHWSKPLYAYQGKSVFREYGDTPDGRWRIHSYEFYR